MNPSFEQALIDVWRRALVENTDVVLLGAERYSVRLTPKRHLREVDFVFEGKTVRGREQNPATKSRWAEMARSGEKVMPFLKDGRYVANVVDEFGRGRPSSHARAHKTKCDRSTRRPHFLSRASTAASFLTR
jgi:hypothetical protein